MEVRNQDDDGLQPPVLTPAPEMRRGSAVMTGICVALVAIGRLVFWHGDATAKLAGTILFFLLIYTGFAIVQFLFGVSINEYAQNFWRLTGKQKLVYCVMILLAIGSVFPMVDVLFPNIWDHNLMFG